MDFEDSVSIKADNSPLTLAVCCASRIIISKIAFRRFFTLQTAKAAHNRGFFCIFPERLQKNPQA
jgi:hypothetical protein